MGGRDGQASRTASGSDVQNGPTEVKILITNHCPNCNEVNADGSPIDHFDINDAPGGPSGWDNPRIYWQQLPDEDCL